MLTPDKKETTLKDNIMQKNEKRKSSANLHLPDLILLLISGVLFFLADLGVSSYFHTKQIDLQRRTITLQMVSIRTEMEEELSRNLYLVYSMASFISVSQGITQEEFDSLAELILNQSTALFNIAAAPDFVIRYIFPQQDNREVLGMDYRTIPEQWPLVKKAHETGKMTIAGPVELVQGGSGIIARIPVYTGKEQTFWGFVSAVINFETFRKMISSHDYPIDLAIRGKNGTGPTGDLFYGDESLFKPELESIAMPIVLPTGSWQLAARPKEGWKKSLPFQWFIHLMALTGLLASALLIYSFKLNRTNKLEQTNQLRAMSRSANDALVMIDSHDRITFWNPAAEQIFGYTEKEILGQSLHSLIASPEDREQAERGMPGFRKTGRGPIMRTIREVQARRKSGGYIPAELSVSSFQLKGKWFAVGSIRDITERKQNEQQLRLLAATDPLTGILNRRSLMEILEKELVRCRRYKHELSILMIDIDHFKSINDTFGHEAGDEILKAAAITIRNSLRINDIPARYGGEEFTVILPETGFDNAYETAERIRNSINEVRFSQYNGIGISVSIGLAASDRDFSEDSSALLKRADTALYQAKERGRNRTIGSAPDKDV